MVKYILGNNGICDSFCDIQIITHSFGCLLDYLFYGFRNDRMKSRETSEYICLCCESGYLAIQLLKSQTEPGTTFENARIKITVEKREKWTAKSWMSKSIEIFVNYFVHNFIQVKYEMSSMTFPSRFSLHSHSLSTCVIPLSPTNCGLRNLEL